MTTPVVNDGQLKLIGMIPSPWPCFCVAANESVLALRGNEINELIRVVLKEGRRLNRDADNVVELLGRLHKVKEIAQQKKEEKKKNFFFNYCFQLSAPVAREWLSTTVYAKPHPLPDAIEKQILANIPK